MSVLVTALLDIIYPVGTAQGTLDSPGSDFSNVGAAG
jgi:hypothetical protein